MPARPAFQDLPTISTRIVKLAQLDARLVLNPPPVLSSLAPDATAATILTPQHVYNAILLVQLAQLVAHARHAHLGTI